MYSKDLCLIGMNATVLDGAVIEEKAMVERALIKPCASGKLAPVFAKVIRDLTEDELASLKYQPSVMLIILRSQ